MIVHPRFSPAQCSYDGAGLERGGRWAVDTGMALLRQQGRWADHAWGESARFNQHNFWPTYNGDVRLLTDGPTTITRGVLIVIEAGTVCKEYEAWKHA